MVQRANGRNTFPQIFIGDYHVGGCDDLYALEDEGKLNSLLQDIKNYRMCLSHVFCKKKIVNAHIF